MSQRLNHVQERMTYTETVFKDAFIKMRFIDEGMAYLEAPVNGIRYGRKRDECYPPRRFTTMPFDISQIRKGPNWPLSNWGRD